MRSKLILTSTLYLLIAGSLFAQGPSLTKEETVNYIEKKAQEVDGKFWTQKWGNGKLQKMKISSIGVSISGAELYVTYMFAPNDVLESQIPNNCYYFEDYNSYKFNVSNIQDIRKKSVINDSNDPVDWVEIVLKNKIGVGRWTRENYTYNDGSGKCYQWKETENGSNIVDVVYIPYFQNDPTNLDKIKKALLYLKELCDAEEDPFGN